MTLRQWVRLAAELMIDLVTGKLERKPRAPDPDIERARRVRAERYSRASRGAGCEACGRGNGSGVHTCGARRP